MTDRKGGGRRRRMRLHLFLRASHLPKSSAPPRRRPSTYAAVSTVTGFGDILGHRRHPGGRTEVVPKSSNPEFATVIMLDHDESEIEEEHHIAVDLFHARDDGGGGGSAISPSGGMNASKGASNGDRDELIGGVILDVSTILQTRSRAMSAPLIASGSADGCAVTVQIDVANDSSASSSQGSSSSRPTIKFQLRGRRLHNPRLLSVLDRPSYYYDVHRKIRTPSGDSWGLVYRSNTVADSLNPMWDVAMVYLEQFCNSDLDWPIRVSILDVDGSGKRSLMGWFETTPAHLMDAKCVGRNWDVERAFVVRKGPHKFRGRVAVVDAEVVGGYERVDSPRLGHGRKSLSVSPSLTSSASASGTSLAASASASASAAGFHSSAGASELGSSTESVGPTLERLLGSPAERRGRSAHSCSSPKATSTGGRLPASPASPASSSASSLPPLSSPAAATAVSSPPPPGPSLPAFDDYVHDDHCRVEMCVALDFTETNGDPQTPGTHHYLHPPDGTKNDYEFTLTVIGSVVSKFASPDFTVWGFGARFGDDSRVYNIFQCGPSAKVRGVEGLVEAYRSTLLDLRPTFGRGTDYGDVIQAAASRAAKSLNSAKQTGKLSYTILLVITPGDSDAFDAVESKLEMIGRVPLSILFVCLDGGGGTSHASLAEKMDLAVLEGGRSVLTFIDCGAHSRCSKSLARAAFEEIPDHVVEFFVANRLYPKERMPQGR